ncbi:MAG: EAL domain-containing protein [Colwellia sp.]|nr:EAL domain-containing protein [Colwellia sp.]
MTSFDVVKVLADQYMLTDPLHHLFDAVETISVQGYDENRNVIYWNKGSEHLYGYKKEEALGKKLEALIIPDAMCKFVIAAHSDWINKGIEIPSSEIVLRHKNGSDVSVLSSHALFTNQLNRKQMYCIDIDLTDVKQAQAQATLKEQMLKATFLAMSDLFFLMDKEGTIIDYYASNKNNLYVKPEDFIGKPATGILPDEVTSKFKIAIAKVLLKKEVESFEYELNMPYGIAFFEARISHLPDHNQVVTIVRDITEKHKSAEVIRQQAYYDTLTGLPNRFLALDRLSQMLNEAQRNKEKIAILFIDLDDFKKVNDSLGHEIGDKLLVEFANRLNQIVRKEDTVGRLGGDEFIVLLRDLSDDHDAAIIAENLLNISRKPFGIDGRELLVTLSIGIAIYPDNGLCASKLLRNADSAMYQAKALGRNTYSFFTREMNVTILRRLEVEEQMHGALERNEFEVYYQPQFDVKNHNIIGAEALLRWHNPTLGNITPDEFIPIAEHTGLIVPIGQFVVKQSLNFLSKWQNQHNKQYRMAVNLSPRQFRDAELLSFIQKSLHDAKITTDSLELEITEGVLMIGQSYIDNALKELNKLGIKLSMDDFGTGYSSLSYLRQYDFDIVKIDKSFIQGIPKNKTDYDLVNAIIAMSQSLGLKIVAEGVETKEQANLLIDLQCDFLQGYYFSKPIPADALIAFSENYSSPHKSDDSHNHSHNHSHNK